MKLFTYFLQAFLSFILPLFFMTIGVFDPEIEEINILSLMFIFLVGVSVFPVLTIVALTKKSRTIFVRTMTTFIPIALAVWFAISVWHYDYDKLVQTARLTESAINSYKEDTGVYPSSLDILIPEYFISDDEWMLRQFSNFKYFYNDTTYAFYYPEGMIDKSVWNSERDKFDYRETWSFE